jgi:hypothetical protein
LLEHSLPMSQKESWMSDVHRALFALYIAGYVVELEATTEGEQAEPDGSL